MRILKIICVFFCLASVAEIVFHAYPIHWLPADMTVTNAGGVSSIWSLVLALFFAIAFYGIHSRALLTWKLGWIVLVAGFLSFEVAAVSSSLKLPQPDRWIASSAIIVVGLTVISFWGFWWMRQKHYFAPHIER